MNLVCNEFGEACLTFWSMFGSIPAWPDVETLACINNCATKPRDRLLGMYNSESVRLLSGRRPTITSMRSWHAADQESPVDALHRFE